MDLDTENYSVCHHQSKPSFETCDPVADASTSLQRTQFGNLDEVVVEKILSLLSPQERICKRLICRYWNHLIQHRIGIKVEINGINIQLIQFASRCVLSTIHLKRFNSTLTKSKKGHRTIIDPKSWLRYPHRVKSLIADQYIDVNLLEDVLDQCRNLKFLRASIRSLISTSIRFDIWRTRLPFLISLQILQNIYSATRDCDLALEILQLRMPHLKFLSLRFQLYQANMDFATISSLQLGLLNFLKRNPELDYVYIEFRGRALVRVPEATSNRHYFSQREFESETPFRNLKHLCVRLPQTCGPAFWELLYKHQLILQKLVLQLPDVHHSRHVETIQRNKDTLTTLSLHGNAEEDLGIIDYNILASCKKLQNLHLETTYREDRTISTPIQLPVLPQSLIRLDISWIKIKTNQLAHIAKLPNLHHLALVGCGEEDDYGVTVPLLTQFFSHRSLEELFIFNMNHHYIQFYMRRLVQILQHLQRFKIRVHIREGAVYIVQTGHHNHSWYWGSNAHTQAPAYFVSPYLTNDQVHDIV